MKKRQPLIGGFGFLWVSLSPFSRLEPSRLRGDSMVQVQGGSMLDASNGVVGWLRYVNTLSNTVKLLMEVITLGW